MAQSTVQFSSTTPLRKYDIFFATIALFLTYFLGSTFVHFTAKALPLALFRHILLYSFVYISFFLSFLSWKRCFDSSFRWYFLFD